jgi:hypothetical protein
MKGKTLTVHFLDLFLLLIMDDVTMGCGCCCTNLGCILIDS